MPRRGRPPLGHQPDTDLPELLDLWNRACTSPHGIAIASTNPNRLAQKLYTARRLAGHNAYDHLRVVEMPDEVRICPR